MLMLASSALQLNCINAHSTKFVMGNFNCNLNDNLGCYQITKHDYLSKRTSKWSHQPGYLYQTNFQQVGMEKLKVITYHLDLTQTHTLRYFDRLKMMGEYLMGGNLDLPLLCINTQQADCSCSDENDTLVEFYYQQYEVMLQNELIVRQKYNQRFTEPQIWYILYNLLNAIKQFEPFSQSSGTITLSDILLNVRGEIKLKNILSSPNNQYQIKKHNYSPQQLYIMKRVYKKDGPLNRQIYMRHNINPNICQTYSLAVTILSLATFLNSSIFYSIPALAINDRAINYAFNQMYMRGYSKLLTNIIRVMMSNYGNRPFPSQIFQTFRPFAYHIMNLKPFHFHPDSSKTKA